MGSISRRRALAGGLSFLVAGCRAKGDAAADSAIGPLLPPADLARRLSEVRAGKVAVFYVGPDALFARGHVPGARKLAALDSDDGPRVLREALASVPADTEIVLYCGCCPVASCPNVRPASAAVRALGRQNARVLDIPTRFATDWTDKGYPVERS